MSDSRHTVSAERGLASIAALYLAGFAGAFGVDAYARANWPRWVWTSDACPESAGVCGQVPISLFLGAVVGALLVVGLVGLFGGVGEP